MKRGLTIFLAVLMTVISLISFTACKDKDTTPTKPAGTDVSVMSFNIRQDIDIDGDERDWSVRKSYVVDHIKAQSPGILCMQEVKENQNDDIKAGLGDAYYPIWYSRTVDKSEEGLAIYFKNDSYELLSQDMFWMSPTPDVESKGYGASYIRICVHAVLREKVSQREISVYCVHLDVDSANAREKEIAMVLDRIEAEGKPSIVCGDFNTSYKSKCFKAIDEVMQSVQDDAPITQKGMTYQDYGGFLANKNSIDFIFVSDDFYCYKFDILDETKKKDGVTIYYSDHYAVRGDVVLLPSSL